MVGPATDKPHAPEICLRQETVVESLFVLPQIAKVGFVLILVHYDLVLCVVSSSVINTKENSKFEEK